MRTWRRPMRMWCCPMLNGVRSPRPPSAINRKNRKNRKRERARTTIEVVVVGTGTAFAAADARPPPDRAEAVVDYRLGFKAPFTGARGRTARQRIPGGADQVRHHPKRSRRHDDRTGLAGLQARLDQQRPST